MTEPTPGFSQYLGNIQHLPGGNYSVVPSMTGRLDEVNPAFETVRSFDIWASIGDAEKESVEVLGYVKFRESLYP